jgi:hypothetical protein
VRQQHRARHDDASQHQAAEHEVIEQLTYLLFLRRLDDMQTRTLRLTDWSS